ncbi:MAG: outer membrane protein assembly factor BamB family protein [Aquihabitans sp.]
MSGVCANCGYELPEADALGLITCPGCGNVTKMAGSTPTLQDPGPTTPDPAPVAASPSPPPSLGGWPAPPVAAPPPGNQWAQPAGVAGAPPTPPPPARAKKGSAKGGDASRTGRRIGCAIVPIAIVTVFAFGIVGAIRSCDFDSVTSSSSAPDYGNQMTLSGSGTLLTASGDGTDVVMVLQDTEDSQTTRSIARIRFSGDASKLLWTSEPLDEDAYRVEVAQVGDTLFAGVDDQLYALDAKTGATQWQTTLRDKLTVGCDQCFAAAGDRLVVRTTDAYLTAFGTRSDEPQWTKRLVSTSGSMSVVGDRLFVVDEPESKDTPTPVLLVDPATGKTIRSTTPRCPKSNDTPWDLAMSAGDDVRGVPGGQDVYAVFGFGDTCVVRWNPGSGAIRWTSRLTGMSSYDEDEIVDSKQDLVLGTSGNVVVAVDLTTGKARQLEVTGDVAATPSQIVGRTLVALTVTTRGTPKGGMAAWDLATGERLWANASLGGAQPVSTSSSHTSDALFDGSPRSLLVPVDGGVNSFVFEGTERTFTVAPVDLATGELGTQVRRGFATRYDSGGTVSLTIEGQGADDLVVSIDNLLQTLPVSGKGDVVTFPEKN